MLGCGEGKSEMWGEVSGVWESVLRCGEMLGEVWGVRRSVERGGVKCVGVWGR